MRYKNKRLLILGVSLFLFLFFYLFRNLSTIVVILGFVFGLFVFYIFDHMFEIDFRLKHYYYIIFILSGGMLLYPLYFIYPVFDKLLHLIMPVFGCFLVFYIVDRKNLSLQWKLLITFMFVLSFIAIHEMGEYILDIFWDVKLQGVYMGDGLDVRKLNLVMSKIDDTMMDMILGMMGSFLFVAGKTIGWFFRKKK